MISAKACICMSECDGSISVVRIVYRRWTDKEVSSQKWLSIDADADQVGFCWPEISFAHACLSIDDRGVEGLLLRDLSCSPQPPHTSCISQRYDMLCRFCRLRRQCSC